MSGFRDFDPANLSNWDVSYDIQQSPLWPYCGNAAGIFRCPADEKLRFRRGRIRWRRIGGAG